MELVYNCAVATCNPLTWILCYCEPTQFDFSSFFNFQHVHSQAESYTTDRRLYCLAYGRTTDSRLRCFLLELMRMHNYCLTVKPRITCFAEFCQLI